MTPSTRVLHSLLSSLSNLVVPPSGSSGTPTVKKSRFKRTCSVYISPEGLTFIISGLVKTSQASVNIQSALFASYELPGSEDSRGHDFTLDIDALLTSLGTLGGERDSISCEVSYDPLSRIFKTSLKDR